MRSKRCPYCKGIRIWEVHSWSGIKRYYMECADCHWGGPKAMTRKGAVIKWNLQKNYISRH